MERPRYFEDYEMGKERRSHGRTITETDFVVHTGHTGDFFLHHMDAEHIKDTPFGQHIAHGMMTFAISIGLTTSKINPLAFTYGYEHLRFPSPVFIGDMIHTVLTVSALTPDPKCPAKGFVTKSCRVINQRSQVVLAYDYLLLTDCRPA